MQKLYHTLFKQIYCLIFLKQIKLPFPFSSSNSMNERHIGSKKGERELCSVFDGWVLPAELVYIMQDMVTKHLHKVFHF